MLISTDGFNFSLGARRSKFGVGSLIMFLVMGAAFLAAGVYMGKAGSVDPHWVRVSGRVTNAGRETAPDGSVTYAPTVSYRVNGYEYQVTSDISSSSYPAVGAPKQVAYSPGDPRQAKLVQGGGLTFLVLVFGGVGVVMLLLAPGLFVSSLVRGRDIGRLKQTGQAVKGVVTEIISTNNRNAGYKIVVSAPDLSGVVRNFVSDAVVGVGGLAMMDFRTHPVPMDVYINPANPNDYYVDVSEVPNLTPERITQLIGEVAHNPGMIAGVVGASQPLAPAEPPTPTTPADTPAPSRPPSSAPGV